MANRLNKPAGVHRYQYGAAMVEMALSIPLFLVLVFGILEFGVAVFNWSLVIEATRSGARYAIVSNEECAGVNDMVCSESETSSPVECKGLTTGSPMLAEMRSIKPNIADGTVSITYSCSDAGFSERPRPVLKVTVETVGVDICIYIADTSGY